jgi:hypothetical protein
MLLSGAPLVHCWYEFLILQAMVLWASLVCDSAAGLLVVFMGTYRPEAPTMGSIGHLDLLACMGCHGSVLVVFACCVLRCVHSFLVERL